MSRQEQRLLRVESEVRLFTARLIRDGYSDLEIADGLIGMALVLMTEEEAEEAA